jgi:hypothetical protein
MESKNSDVELKIGIRNKIDSPSRIDQRLAPISRTWLVSIKTHLHNPQRDIGRKAAVDKRKARWEDSFVESKNHSQDIR